MALRIVRPSHPVKPNQEFSLTVVCDDPGTVELTYSGPIIGPSSVVIPGKREYQVTFSGGQYLAALQAPNQGQDRVSPITWLVDINWSDVTGATSSVVTNGPSSWNSSVLLQSARIDAWGAAMTARVNWLLGSYLTSRYSSYAKTAGMFYILSLTPSSNPTSYGSKFNYEVTRDGWGNRVAYTQDGSTLKYRYLDRYGIYTEYNYTCNPSNTMGNTEAIIASSAFRTIAKYQTILSSFDIEAWLRERVLPNTTAQLLYNCEHENVGKLYDSGELQLDLGSLDLREYPHLGYGPPSSSVRCTDIEPVKTEQSIVIRSQSSPGTATILARRRRNGIPDRAAENEKYETAQLSFVVQS